MRNELFTARLVARSVLERTESRGQHYREDHPAQDPAWRAWITWRRGSSAPQIQAPGGCREEAVVS